jgi:hypothetical protein
MVQVEGDPDWRAIAILLEGALGDPALPRYHRAKYHILRAWCTRDPQLQIRLAHKAMEDMVQVIQAMESSQPQEEVDELLKPLWDMLAATEDTFTEPA